MRVAAGAVPELDIHIRATKDIDIVPAPDPANLAKLAIVLERLDAQVEGADEFEEDELPDPLDHLERMRQARDPHS